MGSNTCSSDRKTPPKKPSYCRCKKKYIHTNLKIKCLAILYQFEYLYMEFVPD